jgi:predicted GIY-YIG superfamily endonuclease
MAIVYRHIRLDKNEPFYIGISSDDYRPYRSHSRNNLWRKIVSKTSYEVEILFDGISREIACEKEIEFIKLYGRINNNTGILSNLTDGGDGSFGREITSQHRKNIIDNHIGMTGKNHSEKSKIKIKLALTGQKLNEVRKKKISESMKKTWAIKKQNQEGI